MSIDLKVCCSVELLQEDPCDSQAMKKLLFQFSYITSVMFLEIISCSSKAKITSYHYASQVCMQIVLQVVSVTFLLVCVVSPKESTCETRKNVFLFLFESSFRSSDNPVLTFHKFKCHDVTKCPSMKLQHILRVIHI